MKIALYNSNLLNCTKDIYSKEIVSYTNNQEEDFDEILWSDIFNLLEYEFMSIVKFRINFFLFSTI